MTRLKYVAFYGLATATGLAWAWLIYDAVAH